MPASIRTGDRHEKTGAEPVRWQGVLRHGKQTNPLRQTLSTSILQCLTLDVPTTRERFAVTPGIGTILFWNRQSVFQDRDRRCFLTRSLLCI